ncbi:MAG TPA: aromatic ring-hydroxylating dioxygenase subunit alpha [Stellaceae bacterium]|nr:aromatic ring-hydroxylating dioxygenase subunit alpha [Stellaceae bacterium]
MGRYDAERLRALIEPDRVHRALYIDPELFELEMERIFGHAFIYVGHESQVKNPGDYLATQIGRQPVVMSRHTDGKVHVLFNRCGHRGAKVVGDREGSVKFFRCCYHGWTFRTDGSLLSVPLRQGYDGTSFDMKDPAYGMIAVPRTESYRGFIFASLAASGPTLEDYLGDAKSSIDDMVDRSPEGELEVVGGCFRVLFRANWKIFLENLNDTTHPMVVHESSVRAGEVWASEHLPEGAPDPLAVRFTRNNGFPYAFWEKLTLKANAQGHSFMGGIFPQRRTDPVFLDYLAAMEKAYGKERTEEILAVDRHNTIFYPNSSVQSGYQQVRIIRPLSVDRTQMDVYAFRLKGAPDQFYQHTLQYSNMVNSPGSIIMPDDHEAYNRVQEGLVTQGSDWVSLQRDGGRDKPGEAWISAAGTSEMPMRNQHRTWLTYMVGEAG